MLNPKKREPSTRHALHGDKILAVDPVNDAKTKIAAPVIPMRKPQYRAACDDLEEMWDNVPV